MHKIAYKVGINENTSCVNEDFKSKLTKSSEFIGYRDIEESRQYRAKLICSDIQYYTTGIDSYEQDKVSEIIPYDIYLFFIIFFISTIGIPILIIQKYGGWRAVSLTSLLVFIVAAIITPIIIILSTLDINFLEKIYPSGLSWYTEGENLCLILGAIAAFIIFQSMRILKKNNYSLTLVVNLGFLSVLINSVWLTILLAHGDYDHPSQWFLPFVVLLLIYSCLFPIQKKILLRNLSLPKLK